MNRRIFLTGSVSLPLLAQRQRRPEWMSKEWKIDARCVLPRGPKGDYDARVVGDPCIVWDDEVSTWRMFYFPSPGIGAGEAPRGRIAGMALSRSAEEIGPGDWRKIGPAPVANPFDEIVKLNGHKFWVVLDALAHNRAARIDGRYWGMFIVGRYKHVYATWAERLAGPWTVVEKPILSPGEGQGAVDGRHCDTPTAYWMRDRKQVLIVYKAYPRDAQKKQPGAPFGSSSVVAWWRPSDALARKANQVIVPGGNSDWNRGWAGGFQLLRDNRQNLWYALMNGSPTGPEDDSHREPAPSLGGWAVCKGKNPDGEWVVDNAVSPFVTPEKLTAAEIEAGLGVNFWRHHLLVTPSGKARIFFNSGPYGTEQMYSLIPG
jgi:hypothetical protein